MTEVDAHEVDRRVARVVARTRASPFSMALRFRLDEDPAVVELVGWRDHGRGSSERSRRVRLTDLLLQEARVLDAIDALESDLRQADAPG